MNAMDRILRPAHDSGDRPSGAPDRPRTMDAALGAPDSDLGRRNRAALEAAFDSWDDSPGDWDLPEDDAPPADDVHSDWPGTRTAASERASGPSWHDISAEIYGPPSPSEQPPVAWPAAEFRGGPGRTAESDSDAPRSPDPADTAPDPAERPEGVWSADRRATAAAPESDPTTLRRSPAESPEPFDEPDQPAQPSSVERLASSDDESANGEGTRYRADPAPSGDPTQPGDAGLQNISDPLRPERPPTGQELADMHGDKRSRSERALRTAFRRGEDALDATSATGDRMVVDLEAPSPTGHPETRVPGSDPAPPPQHGIDGGDATSALFVASLGTAQLLIWGRNKFAETIKRVQWPWQ
ncbi:hypothetical protein [Allonocardiopsis opalescens]|uniref:Uncharacterized protein n=1 Tax=Allonocardiopsis opalescens TaxID=1144618 RepID=A0A2T0QDY8_9ACTN|nr:hypothetical protein [Allonocardiopsis opalescens]PRY02139.1 hypothetical protein CLV72_101739 [Allonocardiopsis opalescens]